MLYRPLKERQWDSWIFKNGDTYFMYYINVSENGTRWDGISLATSKDLLHWKEYGRVLSKDEDAIWLGTGCVYRVGNRYLMNYSQEKPIGYQKVYFAQSNDLYHWEKIENAVSEPDGVIYMKDAKDTCDPSARWDSIGVFEPFTSSAPYYGFLTSNKKVDKEPARSGVLGLVKSMDGLHWECVTPACDDINLFPTYEVPEYVQFNGRHYALFCCSSNLAYRFDPLADYKSGGTYYLVSDDKLSNYHLPKGDPMLQGTRDHFMVCMNYVGRTFKDGDTTCYYHIWGEPCSNAWMGLIKEIYEVEPYRLGLRYLTKNEQLKGSVLLDNFSNFKMLRKVGYQPAVLWDVKDDVITFASQGSSNYLETILNGSEQTELPTDLRDGRIIDVDIKIDSGFGAGVYFKTQNNRRILVLLNKKQQRVEFAFINDGWGGNMLMDKEMHKNFEIGVENKVKLFARREFIEVYINSNYVGGYRLTADNVNPNVFGVYSEDSNGSFEAIKVFEMK